MTPYGDFNDLIILSYFHLQDTLACFFFCTEQIKNGGHQA